MADLIVYTTTEPYDGYRAQLEAARQAVRDQYGQHRLVHAADGGCRVCPLAAMDPIHVEVAR